MKFLDREVDPLTAPWHVIYRVVNVRTCECPPEAYHAETCWTAPIYAQLVNELGTVWDITEDFKFTIFNGYGYCNPANPWCKHHCTLDLRDNRIIDPDCFRSL